LLDPVDANDRAKLQDAVIEVLDDWERHANQRGERRENVRAGLLKAVQSGPDALRSFVLRQTKST
jgi:hypothetical protein